MSARRLIALISQKGGSGKTTVSLQLAAGLGLQGYRVALADLDPQESASRWAELAPADAPIASEVLQLKGSAVDMAEALRPVARRVDVVVMDCPPSIEHPHTMSALELCDVALVPVVPSPTDLWATRGIERLILDRQRSRPALCGVLLPNRVMRTALAGDVLEVLQDFKLPVLDAALSQRSAYALSAVRGTSVYGLGRAAAAAQEEVDRLVSAVVRLIEG
ncbi:ParA family partition ATPase [Thauera mechernichensis]|uniref:ParA family partition ATPase n=1 Tax=Thauera mechernichensis TaxID=82788 RepID=A0ABW3WL19_9RHOO|nr:MULTISPECIES: ParA family partition ATPase [Thauera]ENO82841.1 cobyrinic acid ac-diamide synthase [Thauera sp. 27]ENO93736.1 cobyrinic acid ac-diamide synthase [Thauera sp. 28]MDG3065270.1 ParA family partition ATPase [Thauera mechernichensis]WBL64355.1 AAA family ATPase [Thauera sp. WB-2]HAG76274.1 chromosome partitioning protein ParA [Thauera sp.]